MSIFNKKKIKDFFIYGFGQAINLISPFLVMPFLIYNCGQENYGKIGVGFALALILNSIVDYGSYINGVKEISINRENNVILELKFSSIYFSKLFLLVIVILLATVMILFTPFFSKDKITFLLSLFIVVGQFLNPAWFFQGVENFKWISTINIVSKLIYIALVLIFIREKSDFIYANFFLGIGAIIGNSIGLIWLINNFSFSFKNFSFESALKILKDEFQFSLSQVFLSLYQFLPIMLISYISGNFIAGQFRVIDQIVTVFKTYLNMFFYFVYSNICFELNRSYSYGIKVWKQYNGYNFLLLSVFIFIVFLNSELILSYTKIEKNQVAILMPFFQFALLIPLLTAISQPLRQLMFAFDKNEIYINITLITTILNFILLLFFVKNMGLKGAFLAIIIVEIIIILLYARILVKTHRIRTK
jgi:O-antigen/teichoic acid export membrane protein